MDHLYILLPPLFSRFINSEVPNTYISILLMFILIHFQMILLQYVDEGDAFMALPGAKCSLILGLDASKKVKRPSNLVVLRIFIEHHHLEFPYSLATTTPMPNVFYLFIFVFFFF